ncbi:hypothetical protein AAFF_G00294400 [Aldrovandia affinis]|uniref:Uncharacterized protein n=1 Tax=Aldrovandia affinis TaxID=143900 RepID=A0AAD7W1G8_9TELE|nr:hypothetical protein AAFF_G00294400 [Aldrovandia affinis]
MRPDLPDDKRLGSSYESRRPVSSPASAAIQPRSPRADQSHAGVARLPRHIRALGRHRSHPSPLPPPRAASVGSARFYTERASGGTRIGTAQNTSSPIGAGQRRKRWSHTPAG